MRGRWPRTMNRGAMSKIAAIKTKRDRDEHNADRARREAGSAHICAGELHIRSSSCLWQTEDIDYPPRCDGSDELQLGEEAAGCCSLEGRRLLRPCPAGLRGCGG